MRSLKIIRSYRKNETIGEMSIVENEDVLFRCVCLELPFKDNKKEVSCVPEGEYLVKKVLRSTGDLVFWIVDVPKRTGVLIHKGNFVFGKRVDTKGCILPGLSLADIDNDGELDVVHSTEAMDKLLHLLPDMCKIQISSDGKKR